MLYSFKILVCFQGRLNNVLSDIVINNDREPPPSGFSLIDFTVDSSELTIVLYDRHSRHPHGVTDTCTLRPR